MFAMRILTSDIDNTVDVDKYEVHRKKSLATTIKTNGKNPAYFHDTFKYLDVFLIFCIF